MAFLQSRRVTVRGRKEHSVPLVRLTHDDPDDVILFLAMTPETMEFLTDQLPQDDGFTKELYEVKFEAQKELWERHS